MSIVKYTNNRTFNVGQALRDGWEKEWEGEDALIGIRLEDRTKPSIQVTINKVDWFMGIMRVWFEEDGWLCFDHAIEQFKTKKP